MGRVKIKGKKLSATHQDETGSGEEEKIPAQKKRGRPQKALKDEMVEDEARKLKDEDITSGKEITSEDHVKKQQRDCQGKEKVKVESPNDDTEEPKKLNGFRQTTNRRKSKPRRAAEAVVECH